MRGLFALSGDPVTRGHLHVIEKCFSMGATELVVWVGTNEAKEASYLLDLPERMVHVEEAVKRLGKPIKVIGSNDLLVDVVLREGIDQIFRGVRDDKDRKFEETQMGFHELIMPGIKDMVTYVHPDPEWAHVSSSLVKAFAQRFVDVSPLVPLRVKHRLEVKMHRQFMVGITGRLGTGKTWVATELVKALKAFGIPAHHLNVDQVIRDLYVEDTHGGQKIRNFIAQECGPDCLTEDGKGVDAMLLKVKISDGKITPDVLNSLHRETKPHVFRKMREWQAGKNGVILLEWALLVENHMEKLVNNNIIIVDSIKRQDFLDKRGVPAEMAAKFDEPHLSTQKKLNIVGHQIDEEDAGGVMVYQNCGPLDFEVFRKFLFDVMPPLPRYWGKAS